MGISIRNPRVERKVRQLARLEGKSLTSAVEDALDQQLAQLPGQPRKRPTLEEMRAATERFRRAVGLDKRKISPVTKRDWDALWPIGSSEIDEA